MPPHVRCGMCTEQTYDKPVSSGVLLQVTAQTLMAAPDVVALAGALGVPCSPEAASCILLNARAAGQAKGAGSSKDLAKQAAGRRDCSIAVKVRVKCLMSMSLFGNYAAAPLGRADTCRLQSFPASVIWTAL